MMAGLAVLDAPFFTSLKVAMATSAVGAIVGELPTGAIRGLGARLLAGIYYGQTVENWSVLFASVILPPTWAIGARIAVSLPIIRGYFVQIFLKGALSGYAPGCGAGGGG